ncbi:MAG: ABC transporter substrate-binding protein [Thaumarchaeota archaeon]|nr:ABC transporter substrate-binding protein [Nitrososphaerota archaeon]
MSSPFVWNHSRFSERDAISQTVAIIVIVVVLIAAIAGAYYYYGYYAKSAKPPQSFSFALEGVDATHAVTVDALNHMSQYGVQVQFKTITDPSTLTSAASNGQIDMFGFQFPTTTLNAIESGANLVGIGEETTAFLQDLVVTANITTFQQLNGTTMAAYQLDGPVLLPFVFQAYGQNYSQYKINLVVIGDSSVKAQALIAGRYVGGFLDPEDAATVFKDAPGKFHILGTTAPAFPGIGGGIYFANKAWLNSHFQIAVDFMEAVLQSSRNSSSNLPAWINSTYKANFTGLDFSIYNSTEYILQQSDFFSPNMITFTPALMNASDNFLYYGGLINSSGNVNQMYNFSVVQAALKALGTVQEPAGPFQNDQPLSIIGIAQAGSFAATASLGTIFVQSESESVTQRK